jgi:hypothetical protein
MQQYKILNKENLSVLTGQVLWDHHTIFDINHVIWFLQVNYNCYYAGCW